MTTDDQATHGVPLMEKKNRAMPGFDIPVQVWFRYSCSGVSGSVNLFCLFLGPINQLNNRHGRAVTLTVTAFQNS